MTRDNYIIEKLECLKIFTSEMLQHGIFDYCKLIDALLQGIESTMKFLSSNIFIGFL